MVDPGMGRLRVPNSIASELWRGAENQKQWRPLFSKRGHSLLSQMRGAVRVKTPLRGFRVPKPVVAARSSGLNPGRKKCNQEQVNPPAYTAAFLNSPMVVS